MVCIKKRYFNLNRLLLLAVGLWPDKQTNFTRFQAMFLYSLLMSFNAFQLSRFFITECNFELVVRTLCTMTFYVMMAVQFTSFWINIESMKHLLNQLQRIYDELKDINEIVIYERYGYTAKRYMFKIIILIVCSLSTVTFCLYWPFVLDIVMPKNESYAIRIKTLVTTHFTVSEKYYFFVILHMHVTYFIGSLGTMAINTLLMSLFKYVCGMFEIASYRIQQTITNELLHNFDMKNKNVIYRKIIYAVDIHRKAIKFAKCTLLTTKGTHFCFIITVVLCLSLNLFQMFQIESPAENMEKVLLHFFGITVILLLAFLINYIGQEVTDHSTHLYISTYEISWYLAPVHVQKLLLFLLQRSSKTFTLKIGELFPLSFECFATLLNASVSYFTFMYSTQQ